jgi:hypothetical protein
MRGSIVPPGRKGKPLGTDYWVEDATSPMPLIISQYEMNDDWSHSRRYYVWLFGPAFKLPFEWPIEPVDLDISFDQSLFGEDVPAH